MVQPYKNNQNRIDEPIKESAEKVAELEAILHTLAEPVVIYNVDGVVRKVNQATIDAYGFDPTGLNRVELARISKVHYLDGRAVPPEELPSTRALNGERVLRERLAFSSAKGEGFYVEVSATPLLSCGKVVGAVATWHDVTEQENVGQALRESEKKYRRIIETAYEGVWIINAEEKTTFVNERMAKLLGYTVDEMVDRSIFEFMDEEARADAKDKLERRRRGIAEAYEFKFKKKNDADLWTIVSANPLYDAKGRYTGALAMITDITDRKRAEQLNDALNCVNTVISSTLDFDEIMQKVVVEAASGIGSEGGIVLLRDGVNWVLSYAYGYPKEVIGTRLTSDEARHATVAARKREPVIINDTSSDERANQEVMQKFGIRSVLTVPLMTRGDSIGALCFCYRSRQVVFDESEVDFAGKLATSISLALENARLYAAERRIADTLQEALITMPQKVKGVEFSHLYLPATEATKVGGDFYDLYELEHGKIGIVIGDISGKGIEAATLTALVKNTIRAYALEGYSPALVMAKTNNAVVEVMPQSTFVTVCFGVLDAQTGCFTYCSAGHPPAILKRRVSGEVSVLSTRSPIIGAFTDVVYFDDEINLETGDVLVLYTDGLVEARCNGNNLLGEERLIEILRGLEQVSTGDMPYAVLNTVTGCAGGKFVDDMAILAVSLSDG